MLAFVFIIIGAAALAGLGTVLLAASRSYGDVDRFHRARGITTGWAKEAMTRPLVPSQTEETAERPAARSGQAAR